VSPKQTDPNEGDVMSALPRTRPHRSTARRAAARESVAAPAQPARSPRRTTAKPRPAATRKAATPPPNGYATDASSSGSAPVDVIRGALEGVVKGVRSRLPFLH
jgi:hypothetical protein